MTGHIWDFYDGPNSVETRVAVEQFGGFALSDGVAVTLRVPKTGASIKTVLSVPAAQAMAKAILAKHPVAGSSAPASLDVKFIDGRREAWIVIAGIGGYVCAEPDAGKPDGMCGMPVESEPCDIHHALTSTAPYSINCEGADHGRV
jgi:hypothetical protein